MRSWKGLCVLIVLAITASTMAVAEQKAVVWLAFNQVNSGMMDQAVASRLEDREFYDGLMADGTILDWGLGTRVTHRPDDGYNFVHWVVLSDWGKIDPWVAGAMKLLMSRTPEEKAAALEKAAKIFAPDSHSDIVAEAISWSGTGEAKPRYVYIGEFFAHPGQEGKLTEIYKTIVPPIGQKLMDEGLVAGFGLHTPGLHTGDGWTHTAYMMLTGLAAVDRYHEEVRAAVTPELAEKMLGIHDVARHRDSIWMILHHGATAGKKEEM